MKRIILIALMLAPLLTIYHICEASIMSRLCLSFANVLDDEEAKADAAVKNCKSKCDWVKKKKELIAAAQKKVDDSCAKGITPDITKVSAGLDKNIQAKLRNLYNQHSKMYDGKADLPDKDFGLTTKLNQSPGLTVGKGGQIADLKTSEPAIPKLNSATEFSLSGTKLSRETPGQAATKQSPILLASASSAKSPAAATASAKTAVSATAKASAADIEPGVDCAGTIEAWAITNPEYAATCNCSNGQNAQPVCGCSAGKVTIDGPKDLLLFKPYTNSPKALFKVITSKPLSKIQWSLSNAKVKFTSGTNQKTAQVIPVLESKPEGDVTITATVDNCPPVSLALTVRRPVSIEHEPLKFHKSIRYVLMPSVGTKGSFMWTVKDQFLKPLGNTRVSEVLWCDSALSSVKCWKAGFFSPFWPRPRSWTTESDGTVPDIYTIPVLFLPKTFKLVVHQDLGCQGYTGRSHVTITESSIVGTSPVELK
ncbi:MAG: hypothetical protein HY796_06655 [Elusimicrobia bacterium]|nr:hypothetical protein [Elusimicrobiota bacterium]